MANRVGSYFQKVGHSATQTELEYNEQPNLSIMNKHKMKRHKNWHQNRQQRTTSEQPLEKVSNELRGGGGGVNCFYGANPALSY